MLFYYVELCQKHRPERSSISFERLKVYSGLNRTGTLLYDYRWDEYGGLKSTKFKQDGSVQITVRYHVNGGAIWHYSDIQMNLRY